MPMTSEAALVWSISVAVVAAIVIPYYVSFRRRARRDAARKREAAALGIDRAVAQFPYVDATRCIGCGTCVDACPEGDVLAVVRGTAAVVNGLRCVGHAECEAACPVGAIEVGLGDVRAREDVPLLDAWNESTVPGLFVAGELGGLALIRNAIAQGRRVADRIATRAARLGPRPAGVADVLVVGAGPAGLSAALRALELGLAPVVLEQERDLGGALLHYPRRKLVLVQPVELPFQERLRDDEYTKEELLVRLQGLLGRAHLDVAFDRRVTEIHREEGGGFRVATSDETHRARFLVLALGRRGTPRKLGVPGETLAKVAYKLVDAESYRGRSVLVVGGGDSAVEAAIGLGRHDNEVTLSYRREKLVRIKARNEKRLSQMVAEARVRLVLNSHVEEICAHSVTLKTPVGRVALPNDDVFIFVGGEPPFPLLHKAGIRFGGGAGP